MSLPSGYKRLEYIQSTGTQYIDTGLSFPNGYVFNGSVVFTALSKSTEMICGATTAVNPYNRNTIGAYENKWFLGVGGYGTSDDVIVNIKFKIDASTLVGYHYLTVDGTSKSLSWGESATTARSSDSVCLFGERSVGKINCASGLRLYGGASLQSGVGGELKGCYFPARRNSDGAVGLYDLVTKSFFGNAGTGTFIAGAEIPQTIDGFLIDKIKDFGTWTVTAANGTKTATQDVLVDVITEYEIEMSLSA